MKEEELITKLLQPETRRDAFGKIVESYSRQVYWQVRKMVGVHNDADDIVQNVFMKAWINIESFRGDAKITSWLYRIAHNETVTFLNSRERQPQATSGDEGEILMDRLECDEYFDGDEVDRKLQLAIATLPDKQRAVFLLRFYQEMKYEEMANVLKTSVGALKASYHHAARKIEDFMKEE